VAPNDIIVVIESLDGTTTSLGTLTGFTTLDTSAGAQFGPDGQSGRIMWKRATAADTGSYTFSAGTYPSWSVQCFCFSGRDPNNPPVNGVANNPASTTSLTKTMTATGVTALAGDDLLWTGVVDVNGAGTINSITVPAGYSGGLFNNNVGGFGGGVSAYIENVPAGATGSVGATGAGEYTLSSSVGNMYDAWLIRIPAAPGLATLSLNRMPIGV
jgi:hypothetical protein